MIIDNHEWSNDRQRKFAGCQFEIYVIYPNLAFYLTMFYKKSEFESTYQNYVDIPMNIRAEISEFVCVCDCLRKLI